MMIIVPKKYSENRNTGYTILTPNIVIIVRFTAQFATSIKLLHCLFIISVTHISSKHIAVTFLLYLVYTHNKIFVQYCDNRVEFHTISRTTILKDCPTLVCMYLCICTYVHTHILLDTCETATNTGSYVFVIRLQPYNKKLSTCII